MAFSPDGLIVAAGRSDGVIELWDAVAGTSLVTLSGHDPSGPVWGITFSPDGTLLASAGDDGTIRLWGLPAE